MTISRPQVIMFLASLALLAIVWQFIKRDRLRPAYALLWLLTSFGFLFFVVFREFGRSVANFFGVEYAPSFFFALSIFFILILSFFQTTVLSSLAKRNAELAERVALLQWRIEQLEEQTGQMGLLEIPPPEGNSIEESYEGLLIDQPFVSFNLLEEEKVLR